MKNLAIIFITLMMFGFMGVSESQAGRFEKRHSIQHDRTDHPRAGNMCDEHLSIRERTRIEHRHDMANRHNYRIRHNDRIRCDRDYYDDDYSFRKSSVVVPILLPPLPPPPLIFPGMHIRIFSSR